MVKFIPLAVVLAMAVSVGTYYHGKMTDRWNPADSHLLRDFTERIPMLPLNVGDWRGTEETIPDKEFKLTHCTAYVSRRYVNRKTNEVISVYVVSGTARHITIHSPDWCYQGAGYKMDGKPQNFEVAYGENQDRADLLTAAFRKRDPANPSVEEVLRIFWTYSDDGNWRGPNSWGGAKAYYAGRPALCKIYFICNATGRDDSAEASPLTNAAQAMLPEFNQVLFAESSQQLLPDIDDDLKLN